MGLNLFYFRGRLMWSIIDFSKGWLGALIKPEFLCNKPKNIVIFRLYILNKPQLLICFNTCELRCIEAIELPDIVIEKRRVRIML